ncbi:MAG: TetR/AcrR family transcriptional regulator [Anaerolineae bacterium]|nr:TetR/AcrR family transcriptional regulator [Anaerolineae bacterium]
MNAEVQTQEKIVLAALDLILRQGIKKTGVDEIARQAGVTRATVYRYFDDKRSLVHTAFLRLEQVFHNALLRMEQDPHNSPGVYLDQMGQEFHALPSGDLITRLEELKRLYPSVYAGVQEVRSAALEAVFDHLLAAAEEKRLLRPGLKREVVQVILWEFLLSLLNNPRLSALGLSNAELYSTVLDILLYGILQERTLQ